MKLHLLVFFLFASFFFLSGCTGLDSTIPGMPFTFCQLVSKTYLPDGVTNATCANLINGDLNNFVLGVGGVDGNSPQWYDIADLNAGGVPGGDTNWSDITGLPIGCEAGYAIQVLDDTLTCVAVGGSGGFDGNVYSIGIMNQDTNAVNIDLNMNGNSIINAYDVNASNDFHVGNIIYSAYLCDNFGVGCWDMRGDPWIFTGMDIQVAQDILMDGNILPVTTLISNLGSGANRWLNLFVSHINTEDFTATGDVNTSGRFCMADGNCFNSMADINGGGGTGSIVDTNWQTSFDLFDVNMKAVFQQKADLNSDVNAFVKTTYQPIGNYLTSYFDSNWETSWSIFDANMRSYYPLFSDVFGWIDGNKSSVVDSNWETSFDVFDANMKATYPIFSDVFSWIDGNAGTGGIDTNWQTSWSTFDTNMRSYFALNTDVITWIDGNKNYVTDSNWQTDWATFDTNMRATYNLPATGGGGFDGNIYSIGLMDNDTNSWDIDLNVGGHNVVDVNMIRGSSYYGLVFCSDNNIYFDFNGVGSPC